MEGSKGQGFPKLPGATGAPSIWRAVRDKDSLNCRNAVSLECSPHSATRMPSDGTVGVGQAGGPSWVAKGGVSVDWRVRFGGIRSAVCVRVCVCGGCWGVCARVPGAGASALSEAAGERPGSESGPPGQVGDRECTCPPSSVLPTPLSLGIAPSWSARAGLCSPLSPCSPAGGAPREGKRPVMINFADTLAFFPN